MRKSRRYENDAVDLYQQAGYETYLPPKAKYREQDVFGLFDILAFGHGRLEAVQVKGSRDAAGVRQWFRDARVYEEHIDGLRLAFLHRKAGAWRLARTMPDGYEWVYDGRGDGPPNEMDLEIYLTE